MDAQGLEWRAAGDLPAGSAGIARLAARIEASAVVLSAEAAERGITIALGRKPAGRPRAPRRRTADHLAWGHDTEVRFTHSNGEQGRNWAWRLTRPARSPRLIRRARPR